MKRSELQLGETYRVADRAMAFGHAATNTNAARLVAFLAKPERPPFGGHPLNVEIEWVDEDLPTREARIAQRIRLRRQTLTQAFERKGMDPPTEDELAKAEAEVRAYAEDKLGRFRGMRQKVYSGQIVKTQEDWAAQMERTTAAKEAYTARARETDERLRARLAPLLADAPSDLRDHLLAPKHLKDGTRVDLDYGDLARLLEAAQEAAETRARAKDAEALKDKLVDRMKGRI